MEMKFEEMVDEAYEYLDMESKGCTLILPTIIADIGTTRLHWKNSQDFLRVINRNSEHFMDFLKKQVTNKEISWYSGNKSDGILIHGRNQRVSHVNDLIFKYINIYVTCPSCKKNDTIMTKNNSRKYKFECIDCGMNKYTS